VTDPLLQRVLNESAPSNIDGTTERILAGALAQFEDFGLRRSTMEDVARRLGISRVTIYRRFASKDALVEAVIMRECVRFFEALDRAVTEYASTYERLVEGFVFTLDYLRGHTLVNRLLQTEPEALLPHLTLQGGPVLTGATRLLADRISQEVDEGRLDEPIDVEVAAELLARLVLSFLLTPQSTIPLATEADARRFARRYLAPPLHVGGDRHSR
jgi:AcrR family transcriptional regulator